MADYRINQTDHRGTTVALSPKEKGGKTTQFSLKAGSPLFFDNDEKDNVTLSPGMQISKKDDPPFPVFIDHDDQVGVAGINSSKDLGEHEIEVPMLDGPKKFKGSAIDTDGDGKPDFVFIRPPKADKK